MQAAIPRLCTLLNIKLRLLPMLYRTPLTSTPAAAMFDSMTRWISAGMMGNVVLNRSDLTGSFKWIIYAQHQHSFSFFYTTHECIQFNLQAVLIIINVLILIYSTFCGWVWNKSRLNPEVILQTACDLPGRCFITRACINNISSPFQWNMPPKKRTRSSAKSNKHSK